jgi:hypothetical protein
MPVKSSTKAKSAPKKVTTKSKGAVKKSSTTVKNEVSNQSPKLAKPVAQTSAVKKETAASERAVVPVVVKRRIPTSGERRSKPASRGNQFAFMKAPLPNMRLKWVIMWRFTATMRRSANVCAAGSKALWCRWIIKWWRCSFVPMCS